MHRWCRAGLLLAALSTTSLASRADRCAPEAGISPCMDADPTWIHAGYPRFALLSPTTPVAPWDFTMRVEGRHAVRPLQVTFPGPATERRSVSLVDSRLTLTMYGVLGLPGGWEAGFVTPFVIAQNGAGADALSNPDASGLPTVAVADPRLVVSRVVANGYKGNVLIESKVRLDVSLPVGDAQSFTTADGPEGTPSLGFAAAGKWWFTGADVSVRLRSTIPLGSVSWGSQVRFATGLGAKLVPTGELVAGGELVFAPLLVSQPEPVAGPVVSTVVPAEWLLSLRGVPMPHEDWHVSVALGGGIPLTKWVENGEVAWRRAPTSPELRLMIAVTWAPGTPRL